MQQLIETRELFTLGSLGVIVRGTHHKATDGGSGFQSSKPPGILLLNSLSPTRAATGDSAVFWADSIARSGYPLFRVDLPGFGDSDGDPPPNLLRFINTGGYGAMVARLTSELVQKFQISGVVTMGLCAGAVSAIYAAAASNDCKGLVLLDPHFHLPLPGSSWIWQKLTGRIFRSAPGRIINNALDRFKEIRLRFRRNPLPENANFLLLKRWKAVASSGLPILLFKIPERARANDFNYLGYILEQAGSNGRIQVMEIPGAGHTFSDSTGKNAVAEDTQVWLNKNILQRENLIGNLPSGATDATDYGRLHLNCLHR
jgi:pimeloyl-ACP methyl ester carboxylesterase